MRSKAARAAPALLVLLPLAGCVNFTNYQAPSGRRDPLDGPDPAKFRRAVSMADADALSYAVRDVGESLIGGAARWTGARPTLQLGVPRADKLVLSIDFTIPPQALAQTGPITVAFLVNDHPLDRVTYDSAGEKRFEKPVPAAWIIPGTVTFVTAGIDKLHALPDGSRAGFLLRAVGFAP